MKPLNPSDHEAAKEVRMRQVQLRSTIELADEKLNSNQIEEAKLLYWQARDLAGYAGDGPKIRIIPEDIDRENWHALNKKVEKLNSAALF